MLCTPIFDMYLVLRMYPAASTTIYFVPYMVVVKCALNLVGAPNCITLTIWPKFSYTVCTFWPKNIWQPYYAEGLLFWESWTNFSVQLGPKPEWTPILGTIQVVLTTRSGRNRVSINFQYIWVISKSIKAFSENCTKHFSANMFKMALY